MGRTSKTVKFIFHSSLRHSSEVEELEAKGHTVCQMTDEQEQYMFLGPNCWRMTLSQIAYLDLALKEARKSMYPKEAHDNDA
jgi:hypothetical protein